MYILSVPLDTLQTDVPTDMRFQLCLPWKEFSLPWQSKLHGLHGSRTKFLEVHDENGISMATKSTNAMKKRMFTELHTNKAKFSTVSALLFFLARKHYFH